MEKICKKCNKEQSISEYTPKSSLIGGYTNECNTCRRVRQNKNNRKKLRCPDKKLCPICEQEKESIQFNIESNNKDNLASICIECGKDRECVRKGRNKIKHICNSCQEEKSGFYFPYTKHGYTTIYPWCKECLSNHRKETGVYDYNTEIIKQKRKDKKWAEEKRIETKRRHIKDPRIRILWQCRKRAIEKGLEYNITKEDIVIPEYCPVLSTPIKHGNKLNYSQSPSIDRIDNSKGYIVGNVQIISMKANTMKNSGTPEELKALAKWIIENIK